MEENLLKKCIWQTGSVEGQHVTIDKPLSPSVQNLIAIHFSYITEQHVLPLNVDSFSSWTIHPQTVFWFGQTEDVNGFNRPEV